MFILDGLLFIFAVIHFLIHFTDEHHIDDEDEAATFINNHVANTTAFIMDIDGMAHDVKGCKIII